MVKCKVNLYRTTIFKGDSVALIVVRNKEWNFFVIYYTPTNALLYRVIHKSVKHFKNSQQIDYTKDHGNSYVDRERKF